MPRRARQTIHPLTILRLWVAAGGRCQFRGCPEELLKDRLTQYQAKFAHIAHIVAVSPMGPRGRDSLPMRDRNKIDNLMLMCLNHHRLIDSPQHVQVFPKTLLADFKREHELRIRHLLSGGPRSTTTVVQFVAPIRGETTTVSEADIREAIAPLYAAEENLRIDMTSLSDQATPDHLATVCREIDKRLEKLPPQADHLSVFAIGPIPLLVHLGSRLSNKIPTEIYQRHRGPESWRWRTTGPRVSYRARRITPLIAGREAALLLSLSGKIHRSQIPPDLRNMTLYEVDLHSGTPNPRFLRRSQDLHSFGETYHTILARIQADLPGLRRLHLLPAIPVPIAVSCGRDLLSKAHPALAVYDFTCAGGVFEFSMEVKKL